MTASPRRPIRFGTGGGAKLLSVAARQADIIQVVPSNTNPAGTLAIDAARFSAAAFADKRRCIEEAAGDRLADIELGTQLLGLVVTDDRSGGVRSVIDSLIGMVRGMGGDFEMTEDEVMESPAFAIGTLNQVCDKLLSLRECYGFTYFTDTFGARPETYAPSSKRSKASDRRGA